ncbi:hypothetical protein [Limosilactobacillus reuteri]|uniref:DUF2029 domain-containing protein n=1 Tax=Limosilactobacillus reuteri TaxID=1598 RepID=A0AAX2SSX5_LIMRT|nr:hypothetical protein [Limosilactobacillus reuteri]RMX26738.1 hypothetical protein C6H63_06700 [Limosilactobacillus reuteri]TGB10470.1 hypothetical protein E5F87_07385 [Limosilactobacillus reuteri]
MFNRVEKYENAIKDNLLKNKLLLFNLLVTIIAFLVRLSLIKFQTGDYIGFLHPWMTEMKRSGGLLALGKQIGDYNVLYQFLIALGSYLPLNDLYLYKGLSIIFDFILAMGVGLVVQSLTKNNKKIYFSFSYAITLLLPTVIFDSALWAQCDSIYATFIIFSIYFLIKNKYIYSFAFLGIAFAFKLQTIFILPVYLILYLVNHRIHIYYYLITLLTFWICGLPAFLVGRSVFSPFQIYMGQTGTYKSLFMNFFNLTGLLGSQANNLINYEALSKFFILFTVFILLVGFMVFLIKYQKNSLVFLELASWTVYTCVMFLPSVHERYSFLVDILLIILAFVNKRYISIAIFEILNSFLGYTIYLFSSNINIILFSYISVLTYIYFTFIFFNGLLNNKVIEK